jgi:hypothetical protein
MMTTRKPTTPTQPRPAASAGDWISSAEAARRIGVQPNTLAEWRCERRLNQPPFAKFGKLVRYRSSDVDTWAANQIVAPLQPGDAQ